MAKNKYKHFNPKTYKIESKIATVRTSHHCKYNINYHIIWIPKYRKQILKDKVKEVLRYIMEQQGKDVSEYDIFKYVIEYEKEFSVIFDFPCENLMLKEGIYSCKTYTKSRPLLCERYPYKLNSREKFDKPINVFRNSQDFLKRIKELREVD